MTRPLATATRVLAHGLALNRVAFGMRFLLQPTAAGPSWVGPRRVGGPGTQLFVRALGARDVALGLGALASLRRSDPAEARRWMLARALGRHRPGGHAVSA